MSPLENQTPRRPGAIITTIVATVTTRIARPGGATVSAATPTLRALFDFAKVLNADEKDALTTIVVGGKTLTFRPAAAFGRGGGSETLDAETSSTSSTSSSPSSTSPSRSETTSREPSTSVTASTSTTIPSSSASFSTSNEVLSPSSSPSRTRSEEQGPTSEPRPTASPTSRPDAPGHNHEPSANPEEAKSTSTTLLLARPTSDRGAASPARSPTPASTQSVTPTASAEAQPSDVSTSANALPSAPASQSPSPSAPDIPFPSDTAIGNNAFKPTSTRTYPLNTSTAEAANSGGGTSKATTAGAIVGGLFAVFAVLALLLFGLRWYKRRNKGDREALMRSSWFYGGDVAIPDDEEEKNTRYNRQSHFSAPSLYHQSARRISHFTSSLAHINPLGPLKQFSANRGSSRIPLFSTLADQFPSSRHRTPGFNPDTDVPRPISVVPTGQGGWASRFFHNMEPDDGRYPAQGILGVANPSQSDDAMYRSQASDQQPEMISRSSSLTRPMISHPFAASAHDQTNNEGQWGHSYLPETAPSPAPPGSYIPDQPYSTSTTSSRSSPTRDLLQRSPTTSSAYSGMVAPPSGPATTIKFPEPRRPVSNQSGMEMLSTTPVTAEFTSTAPAKTAIIDRLNAEAGGTQPAPSSVGGLFPPSLDQNPHASNQFEYASRGVSMADTASVYSAHAETVYTTRSSEIEPDQGSGQAERQSGAWSNIGGYSAETLPGHWDQSFARNAEEVAALTPRKSVRWGDGTVGDGMPRAL